jgi:hypothetical protein
MPFAWCRSKKKSIKKNQSTVLALRLPNFLQKQAMATSARRSWASAKDRVKHSGSAAPAAAWDV